MRNEGTTKLPAATFAAGSIPSRNRYGKAKPRKGRAVSSGSATRSTAFGTIVEAGQISPGMVLQRGKGKPFTVYSVGVQNFDSFTLDGGVERRQQVRLNGAKRYVAGSHEYRVVSYLGQRETRDGFELFSGPMGGAYLGDPKITELVRRAMERVHGADVSTEWKYKNQASPFKYRNADPAARLELDATDDKRRAEFDAEFSARERAREIAGPIAAVEVEEEEDDGIVEFVPEPDPVERKRGKKPRLWENFGAYQ